jgi:hypothetical protein
MPPKSPNAGYQEIAPTRWSTALMGRSQAINADHSGNKILLQGVHQPRYGAVQMFVGAPHLFNLVNGV